jgi:hypothetical protein
VRRIGRTGTVNDHLDVLKLVVERLERERIPYMLTGSVALSYYAEPRFTRDVDIVVQLSAGDALRMANLFATDFYVDAEAIASAVAREGMVNLIHNTTIVKVDLIVRKSTPHHLQEFERRRRAALGGSQLWIVTPEDLLISKLLWLQQGGSTVHRRDIASLRAAGISLDGQYLQDAIDRLGLEALWKDVSND